jgi:hypothetical protein
VGDTDADTDPDLPMVSADVFHEFFKRPNRFIALKWQILKRYNRFIA